MRFLTWFADLLRRRKTVRIGIYGAPNAGKTSLANRISLDWMGQEVGKVSAVPHETRHVQRADNLLVNANGYKMRLTVLDMPGFASHINYKDFTKHGIRLKAAKKRSEEAMQGIIEAIRGLDEVDLVLAVMDSTKDPLNQVDLTVLGNLEKRKIPLVIVANKVDLRKAKPKQIEEAFPKHTVVPLSAKTGQNVEDLYKAVYTAM
jgi:GTPase